MSLFEGWWQEAQAAGRKPSTHENYRNTLVSLAAFLGHDDAGRVTRGGRPIQGSPAHDTLSENGQGRGNEDRERR